MAVTTDRSSIAERFRIEQTRLRKATIRLTLIPIAAGLMVLLTSFWIVQTSRQDVIKAKRETASLTIERDVATQKLRVVQGELQSARESLANARTAADRVRQGINHYQRGEYPEAIENYRAAIAIDPGNYFVYDWLGYAYYRNRQYVEAEASLRKSVEINPTYARGFYNLALILWARGRRDEAIATIAKAMEVNPDLRVAVREDGQFAPFRQAESFRRLMSDR